MAIQPVGAGTYVSAPVRSHTITMAMVAEMTKSVVMVQVLYGFKNHCTETIWMEYRIELITSSSRPKASAEPPRPMTI